MPAGTVNTLERFKRLHEIRDLIEEGKSDQDIAETLGMSLQTIRRNKKYLDDLSVADLTAKEISEKRGELYLELIEAAKEAQDAYHEYRTLEKPTAAKMFFSSWIQTIELRAKLFGLDSMKLENFTQINTQVNLAEPEKIDIESGRKLADMLKKAHEASLKRVN
uniref:Putative DNA binding, helix-turn-helix domain containing protein n=1 Tax=viral metagenome TaxID=1070528 RepID=A0A6H1ZLR9_9ZZZZ